MNRKLTTVELLAKKVDAIKRGIVFYIKRIKKLEKDAKKANGDADKQAILNEMSEARDQIEIYRTVLDDLTYAFVKAHPSRSNKILRHFKYKTVQAYLEDKYNYQRPTLEQILYGITSSNQILFKGSGNQLYQFEPAKDGFRVLNRHFEKLHTPATQYLEPNDIRAINQAAESAMRHK